jgi:hypothetical protein
MLIAGGQMEVEGDESRAVVTRIDPTTGVVSGRLVFEGSGRAEITAAAALDGDVVVGGDFTGTIVLGDQVVSSPSSPYPVSRSFLARIDGETGELVWARALFKAPEREISQLVPDGNGQLLVCGWGSGPLQRVDADGRPGAELPAILPRTCERVVVTADAVVVVYRRAGSPMVDATDWTGRGYWTRPLAGIGYLEDAVVDGMGSLYVLHTELPDLQHLTRVNLANGAVMAGKRFRERLRDLAFHDGEVIAVAESLDLPLLHLDAATLDERSRQVPYGVFGVAFAQLHTLGTELWLTGRTSYEALPGYPGSLGSLIGRLR